MSDVSSQDPIAVDLDGTLLRSDTLHEGVVQLLVRRPWLLFVLLLKLFAGKAAFKQYVTSVAPIDAAGIPEHAELLSYLVEQKGRGRRLGLFSAANEGLVAAFATRFGIFDVSRGSDGRRNLSGADKLAAIREEFGPNFVYAGDAKVDMPIWQAATAAIVVGRSPRLRDRVAATARIERAFIDPPSRLQLWIRALRLHQWAKNILIFVPGILAFPTLSPAALANFALGFVTLGTVASATYLINDLADLSSDRRHRYKRTRPLAACAIKLSHGVAAAMLLGAAAAILCLLLPRPFLLPLGLYVAATLIYSFRIKRIAILDVLCLGFLFTLRIAAGAVLVSAAPPYWLLAFSMFFFTSLAFVKRYTELLGLDPDYSEAHGRGYQRRDMPVVLAAGLASGLCSLVVFLIYLGDQHFNRALFAHPEWLGVTGAIIAYWLLRVWLLTARDEMHDDPVLFALKDMPSRVMGVLVGLALLLAW
jgi:4-hydroxybenzoate polyprenyltransferase/phosphoserine phosphatase